MATYSCNNGYILEGENTRTCQDSGLWSGSEPSCCKWQNTNNFIKVIDSWAHNMNFHNLFIVLFQSPVCVLTCDNGGTPNLEECSTCTCPSGYSGDQCEFDIDECSISGSCFNGVCNNTDGGYMCDCFEGYEGPTCEVDTDDCLSADCQNGATCNDQVAGYLCMCRDGSTGSRCELCDISDCQRCNFATDTIQCSQCQSGYSLNATGLCGITHKTFKSRQHRMLYSSSHRMWG